MKKVGAILAAVAMVVVAFVIRGGDDDPGNGGGGGGGGIDELICPTDLREICEQIDGAAVSYREAGSTADDVIAATDDQTLDGTAWVVPAAWAEAAQATRQFDSRGNPDLDPEAFVASEPIVSTAPAVAHFDASISEIGCDPIEWACLDDATQHTKIGVPAVNSALGLPIAAAATVQILGGNSFDRNDVRQSPFTVAEDPYDTMRSRGPGHFAAAATTIADTAGRTNSNFGAITVTTQPADVRIDLVIVTRRGQSLPGDLEDAIADAFLGANWDSPQSGPSGMPDGDLLNVIREKNS